MDPSPSSAPSTSQPTESTSTSTETPRKSGSHRRGGRSNHQASQGDSSTKAKGPNTHRHDNRKKEKEKADGSAPTPRAPKTIAPTDPIDLSVGRLLPTNSASTETPADSENSAEQHSCFICTENIIIFAVSDCNHRTCHLCSLRLRALYKTKNCTYCKADQGIMIFTRDAEKSFQDYDLKTMAFFDRKLGVYFEDQEMYEDTMVLLRFNCPDPTCEVACPEGWNQLKSHVKKVHKMMLCDLCVRHKKVFAHEHNLMTASQLMRHFKTGDAGQANQNSAEPSGFKGHPECGFCKESFYGDDELYEHCKTNHEQCFLCLRRNIRHQYYNKYPDLENHLHSEHYACMDPECLEKKFVVFDSELDLKAHEAEVHPNAIVHGQRTKLRDSRKIDIGFNYQPSGEGSRRGGRGNRQGGREQGQGRRQQEDSAPRQPQLTPHQIQQIALQQQLAQEQERRSNNEALDAVSEGVSDLSLESSSAGSKSMLRARPPAGFGATLTEPTPVRPQSSSPTVATRVAANIQRTSSPMKTSSPVVVSQSNSDWPAMSAASSASTSSSSANVVARPQPSSSSSSKANVASDTLSKHAALQDRVQQYLQGTTGTLSQFRTLTTQYRNGQIPANQYVASLASLFNLDLEKTGKVTQGLYEVFDSETKKAELMKAWRDFKTVQNQFPSLESTVTSSPTMADIATPSTRRVLVIKSSGTTRGGLGHTKPKSTATWDRAAAAASSLNRTSSPSGTKSPGTPVFYPTPQLNSSAAWSTPRVSDTLPEPGPASSNSSSNTNRSQGPVSWAGIPQSSGASSPAPQFRPSTSAVSRPVTSADQFPTLVSQTPAGTKPSLGLLPMQKSKSQSNQDDTPNGWVTGWSNIADQADEEEEPSTGKKKKNKKKILFHVG
ncbi:hypothetical protein BGX21_011286 [Mortierella sp. AD011]|nr:hypothetical protein BGX20_000960 [Mortierella sp. AD010]KAF9391238.1 hypothetical protein BGX21_011286 [Mortierella sp. AD011]